MIKMTDNKLAKLGSARMTFANVTDLDLPFKNVFHLLVFSALTIPFLISIAFVTYI